MQEVRVGDRGLFAWDGRILEVYGAFQASGGRIFHPAVSDLSIREPDKKGRAEVALNSRDQQRTIVQLDSDDLAGFEPVTADRAHPLARAADQYAHPLVCVTSATGGERYVRTAPVA